MSDSPPVSSAPLDATVIAAKRHNGRVAVFILAIFLAWLPTYLLVVRPAINAWLSSYIHSYPAILHFIPILGPIVLLAVLLGKRETSSTITASQADR